MLLAKLHQNQPQLMDLPAGSHAQLLAGSAPPQAMLLIGDKVVTHRPDPQRYPFDVDLGQAWHQLTGLPFVFATWLARADAVLGDLPRLLDAQRRLNENRID
ncbi:MAG: hypothetical protein HC898_04785, partial [Phycisphaerales bacterium]|nr:hypothetical protein [Phycisphaerales bacterium]